MHEAVILVLENNLTASAQVMEKVFKFLENLEQKTIDSFHYELIFTKMNIVIDELIYSNKQKLALKYVKSLDKLEKKYNYDILRKSVISFKEELKNIK